MKRLQFDFDRYQHTSYIDCYQVKEETCHLMTEKPMCTDYFEMMLVSGGEGRVMLDERSMSFQENALIFSRPNQIRQFWGESFSSTNIIFSDSLFQMFFVDARYLERIPFFQTDKEFIYQLDSEKDEFTIEVFKQVETILMDRKNKKKDLPTKMVDHQSRSLLDFVLSRCSSQELAAEYELEILELKELIETHFIEEKTPEFYASSLLCGVSRINELCKKYYGKTFSRVIKSRMILEIKKRLIYSSQSISEIAYDLEFSDPSNFVRYFKTNEGLTPLKFRKKFLKPV